MPKLEAAIAATLSALLLSACGNGEPAAPANAALSVTQNETGNASVADPAPAANAGTPLDSSEDNSSEGPVPPPDAVSHPNGYLPPAPADPPAANSSSPKPSPATEDQHIHNGQ